MQPSAISSQLSASNSTRVPRSFAAFSRISGKWVPRVSILRPGKPLVFASLAALLLLAGCRQDMQNQPRMFPQRGTTFFADGRSARPQVVNTIARGQLHEDDYFYTGVVQGANGYREERDQLPFPVTMEVLQRGQERFNVYCTPCHSRVGNGLGEIVQRGYKPAANLHDQVRMAQPLSHYFYVMTHGYGAMPDYSAQLAPEDRWAVAAYIRALQLSQAATMADVPAGTQVESLKDVAQGQGLPATYAQPWTLPQTAIYANQAPARGEGTPAMGPANTADPKQVATPGKTASGAAK
jgi:mono/diheme cytochrome c family protein